MADDGYLVEQVILLVVFGIIFVLSALQIAVEYRMKSDIARYQERVAFEKQIAASVTSKLEPLPRIPPTVGKLHMLFHRSVLLTSLFGLLRSVDPHGINGIWDLGAVTFFINNCTNIIYGTAGIAAVMFVELRYRMMLMHVPYNMTVAVAILVALTTLALQISTIQAWGWGSRRRDSAWLHAYMFLASFALHFVFSFQLLRVRREMTKAIKQAQTMIHLERPASAGKTAASSPSVTTTTAGYSLAVEDTASDGGASNEVIILPRDPSDDPNHPRFPGHERMPSSTSESQLDTGPRAPSSPSAAKRHHPPSSGGGQKTTQAMRESVRKMTIFWAAVSLVIFTLMALFLVSVYQNSTERPEELYRTPDPNDHGDALTSAAFFYIVVIILIIMVWFSYLDLRVLIAPIDDYGISQSRASVALTRSPSLPNVLRPIPSP